MGLFTHHRGEERQAHDQRERVEEPELTEVLRRVSQVLVAPEEQERRPDMSGEVVGERPKDEGPRPPMPAMVSKEFAGKNGKAGAPFSEAGIGVALHERREQRGGAQTEPDELSPAKARPTGHDQGGEQEGGANASRWITVERPREQGAGQHALERRAAGAEPNVDGPYEECGIERRIPGNARELKAPGRQASQDERPEREPRSACAPGQRGHAQHGHRPSESGQRTKRVDGRTEESGPCRPQVQEDGCVKASGTPFSEQRPRLAAARMARLAQTQGVQGPQELVDIEAGRTDLECHESGAEERQGDRQKDDVEAIQTSRDPTENQTHGRLSCSSRLSTGSRPGRCGRWRPRPPPAALALCPAPPPGRGC